MPSVENEVEEHNIFHSEVEALAPHINTDGDKVRIKIVKTEQRSCLSIKVSEKLGCSNAEIISELLYCS